MNLIELPLMFDGDVLPQAPGNPAAPAPGQLPSRLPRPGLGLPKRCGQRAPSLSDAVTQGVECAAEWATPTD